METKMAPVQCPLPLGNWSIEAFATYEERRLNATQKDILYFSVLGQKNNTLYGLVAVAKSALEYLWNATCISSSYKGFSELILKISAPNESGLNQCSGIFNFKQGLYASAMYLGASSLITGDSNYTACFGGRYGTVIPPFQMKNFQLSD